MTAFSVPGFICKLDSHFWLLPQSIPSDDDDEPIWLCTVLQLHRPPLSNWPFAVVPLLTCYSHCKRVITACSMVAVMCTVNFSVEWVLNALPLFAALLLKCYWTDWLTPSTGYTSVVCGTVKSKQRWIISASILVVHKKTIA